MENKLRVKEIIKERKTTSKEVAEKLGMTETGFSIAISEVGNPPLKRLIQIADVLGVTVPELFAPQSTSDFTALIDYKGELKRFNSVDELKRFLDKV